MIRRLLIASLVLATAFACGGGNTSNSANGSSSSSSTSTSSSPSSNTITFKEAEYSIAPATQTLKAGTYTFTVQNSGQFPHDLHVASSADGTEVGGSTVVMAGQSASFTVTLKPGAYTLWCGVDAHRSLGMQGTLTVQ